MMQDGQSPTATESRGVLLLHHQRSGLNPPDLLILTNASMIIFPCISLLPFRKVCCSYTLCISGLWLYSTYPIKHMKIHQPLV
jgi:hypothetical protein